jgi:hypothetical protein
LPCSNQLGHGADRIFNGRVGINAVLIVKVNMRYSKALEAGFTGPLYILRPPVNTQKFAVGPADVCEFSGQDYLVAPVANGAPDQLFIFPDTIHVGGVQKIDAQRERTMDGGDGLPLVRSAIEFRHAHAAQSQSRNL